MANGLEEVEATSVIDILRRGGVGVCTASLSSDRKVEGAHGMHYLADAAFEEIAPAEFDAIILPGGMPGTTNLMGDERVLEALRDFNDAGKLIGAICAAPMVLAAAGILGTRKVTCYPGCQGSFTANYVDCEKPVLEDDNLITSKGPGTAVAFALVLLDRLAGTSVRAKIQAGFLYRG